MYNKICKTAPFCYAMPLVFVCRFFAAQSIKKQYILKWQGKDSKVLPKEDAGTGLLKENDFIKNITLYR